MNSKLKDDQAEVRKKLISRLINESRKPLTAIEIRRQKASYIASHIDGYSIEKAKRYLDENYGEPET